MSVEEGLGGGGSYDSLLDTFDTSNRLPAETLYHAKAMFHGASRQPRISLEN